MHARNIPRQPTVEKVIHEHRRARIEKECLDRSGIYAIVNRQNGHKYIGQARCFKDRKRQHLTELANGQHFNPYLQNAYEMYGGENFVFVILEYEGNFTRLTEREQYWIDTLKPEYNAILNVVEAESHFGSAARGEPRFFDDPPYQKPGESFMRPAWHAWVYGGAKNPHDGRKR